MASPFKPNRHSFRDLFSSAADRIRGHDEGLGLMMDDMQDVAGEARRVVSDAASFYTGPIRHTRVQMAEAAVQDDAYWLSHDGGEVTRAFNHNINHLGFVRGNLGASIKGLWYSLASTFGADTSKWGSTSLKGGQSFADVAHAAMENKPGIFERIFSKPFRIAADNPKTAIGVAAVAAAYGVVHSMHHRRDEVTPEDIALMEARMRQGGQDGSHLANLQARREAAMQQNAATQNNNVVS